MVSKVNGIKIYPKHSLGCILSASFGVFVGFMLLIGLNLFPIFGATVNGTVMQVNAFDYFCFVFKNGSLSFLSEIQPLAKVTHIFGINKYNLDLLDLFDQFKNSAASSQNYAVFWYGENGVALAFDYVIAISYLLIMPFALALFIEGIIRLATGTYHKTAKPFTIVVFFLMLVLVIFSFLTNFCIKYIAKEAMAEGETYVSRSCPMQYVVFVICILGWIGQQWVYSSLIKGKLYVANGKMIRKNKNKDNEEDEPKKEKKTKKHERVEEVAEEIPAIEEPSNEEQVVEEASAAEEVAEVAPIEEVPAGKPESIEQDEANNTSNNETSEPKSE